MKLVSFIYLFLLLGLINLFSTSHYEWMLESGDIDNLCQLPSGGRYTAEPIIFLIPCICLLFLIKNKKIRYAYLLIALIYLLWSFLGRYSWC
ncbi:DUF2645 family protein [Gilliamella sp. ESL0250]|uniref:DUF2645 family protein n=1 Tax=Gilliamella sp. ESL0250 TaxID=2705036 RepID=UPI001580D79C|nr:DUF2645 family protein [Gilliamella sp. ESL0250]NUF48336.1 YjeO family protein [Gilliamella sp. ESL0250]